MTTPIFSADEPDDEAIEEFLAERMTPEGRVPMVTTIRAALARWGAASSADAASKPVAVGVPCGYKTGDGRIGGQNVTLVCLGADKEIAPGEIPLYTRAQPQADAAGESHPLNRHCGCTACAPSFEQLVTALQMSAPTRIYLDVGEALVGAAPQQFKELEEVTWSEDNATGHGIPYVRADLAAPQADAAEPVAKGGA